MDLSQLNFDYLRVPHGPESIRHSPDYIKSGTGDKAKRRIYYEVPLDNYEKQQIRQLETEMTERGIRLPPSWNERETLRYLYATRFDHEKAIKRIEGCIEWRKNPVSHTVSRDVLQLFESGALYLYGRDKQYRPIVVFDFGKVDLGKLNPEAFNAGITILLDIAIKYCYVPGKVENNIVIIDTRELSITNLPISAMKNWITIGDACFPSNLFKTFVVGPPFIIRMSWKIIEGLLDKGTAEKIEIIAADELKKIVELVDPSQLEKKFGGALPNLTTYWPPVSTYQQMPPGSAQRKLNGSHHDVTDLLNQSTQSGRFQNMSNSGYAHQSPYDRSRIENMPNPYSSERRPDQGRFTSDMGPRDPFNQPGRLTSGTGIRTPSYQNTSDHGMGNPIFGPRPGRATQGVNHSPMKLREKDEQIVKDILAPSRPILSPGANSSGYIDMNQSYGGRGMEPEKQKRWALQGPPESIGMLEALGENRSLDKKIDERLDRELNLKPSGHSNPYYDKRKYKEADQDLLNMILSEDNYLKDSGHLKRTEDIPDELSGVQDERGGRKSNVKLKTYVDLNHSPERYRARDLIDSRTSLNEQYYNRENQRPSANQYKPQQEVYKKTAAPKHQRLPSEYSIDEYGYPKRSQHGDDSRYYEDWKGKKPREMLKQYADREDSDEDDEGSNFCGICVSKKKGSAKRFSVPRYGDREIE